TSMHTVQFGRREKAYSTKKYKPWTTKQHRKRGSALYIVRLIRAAEMPTSRSAISANPKLQILLGATPMHTLTIGLHPTTSGRNSVSRRVLYPWEAWPVGTDTGTMLPLRTLGTPKWLRDWTRGWLATTTTTYREHTLMAQPLSPPPSKASILYRRTRAGAYSRVGRPQTQALDHRTKGLPAPGTRSAAITIAPFSFRRWTCRCG
ncbi:hypothetical protein C8Q78DRAFT_1044051, partial [Trametes maxima]